MSDFLFRYSDILVHRLLAAGINADATFPDLLNKRVLQQICNNLNYRHRMAQYAARASVDLHTQVCLRVFRRSILKDLFLVIL
jgi:exosome complex exonuclease DIS3/RRP44